MRDGRERGGVPKSDDTTAEPGETDRGVEREDWIIRNQTGRRIGIKKRDSYWHLILPPFGERSLTSAQVAEFETEPWDLHNLVSIAHPDSTDEHGLGAVAVLRAHLWFGVLASIVGVATTALRSSTAFWVGLAGVLGVSASVITLWMLQRVTHAERAREQERIQLWFAQCTSLMTILAIGVGIPASIIYFFGANELLAQGLTVDLLGRILQAVFIAVASLLPALLYYLFDRQHLGTLRESFYRNVIQLEPKVVTMEDARSIYGGRVSEVYGPEEGAGGRFVHGTRLPIIVASLVLSLGWVLTLSPVGTPPAAGSGPFSAFFQPQQSPLAYGFLGAYFFSISMILRRYTRADLKPKAYSHITVRLLVTSVLVWVVSALPVWGETATPNNYLLVFAFFVGIVPETAIRVMREFLESLAFLKSRIPSLDEKQPLNQLEGITLYERARLVEEGIENIENLVYYPLIDLMLQTRIPLTRLIDWVDQGLLYLHLTDHAGKRGEGPSSLEKLRAYGIRNASDLVESYAEARRRGPEHGRALMSLLDDDPEARPKRLQVAYDALQNDEWLSNIVGWRDRNRLPGEHVFELKEMFMSHDELLAKIGPGMARDAREAERQSAALSGDMIQPQSPDSKEPAATAAAN